jgi:hypothetical protein
MKRWAGIISDRLSIGTHLGLRERFLKTLLYVIHKESLQRQADIYTEEEQKTEKKKQG